LTALCVILFSLMHWPCGTTLLTIQNETKSWRWTMLAVLLPTAMGILTCMAVAAIVRSVGGA
ncbi:MAG: Ferrous iron transport B protein, partial [Negativicoccus succinicivorans DORA_17_25]